MTFKIKFKTNLNCKVLKKKIKIWNNYINLSQVLKKVNRDSKKQIK